MNFLEKGVILKDGTKAVFRGPKQTDASALLEYLKVTAGESQALLRYPEEVTMTLEQEESFIESVQQQEHMLMILCEIDGELAGNCALSGHEWIKTRHRADVAIALKKEYWHRGIGTLMFEEMIQVARDWGITQLELEVIEGNDKAVRLYQKMGFVLEGTRHDSIRLKDGTMLKEFLMIKKL